MKIFNSAVYNARGRGRVGGWMRMVSGSGGRVEADPILMGFMRRGDGVSMLAISYGLTVVQVENVIRWYSAHPNVMREVLGG